MPNNSLDGFRLAIAVCFAFLTVTPLTAQMREVRPVFEYDRSSLDFLRGLDQLTSQSAQSAGTNIPLPPPVFTSRPPTAPPLKAFPGAWGFASNASGGRGGQVYVVTNLNDSGAGSLRDAIVNGARPLTIVFQVGGYISLQSELSITQGDLTIAGQTAPGGGICIRDHEVSIMPSAKNVIIRHLRFRLGEKAIKNDPEGDFDALHLEGASNVIIDHCSFSWGTDEVASVTNQKAPDAPSNQKVTFQWNIVAEGLDDPLNNGQEHSKAALFVGNNGSKYTVYANAFVSNDDRPDIGSQENPNDADGTLVDIRANLFHNAGRRETSNNASGHTDRITCANYHNNWFQTGPSSEAMGALDLDLFGESTLHHMAFREKCGYMGEVTIEGQVRQRGSYFAANKMNGEVWPDNWYYVWLDEKLLDAPNFDPGVYMQDDPYPVAAAKTLSSSTIFMATTMGYVGAYLPAQDSADERIVQDIMNATGSIIDNVADVGGWPILPEANHPAGFDSDSDGMADQWEIKYFGSPADGKKNQDPDNDGYTNLEEYLNGSNPHHWHDHKYEAAYQYAIIPYPLWEQ